MESSLAVGAALAASTTSAFGESKPGAALACYELRTYQLRIGAQLKVVNDFLGEVYLPLAKRHGAGPIGAFTLTFGPEIPTVYLLTPYPSLAAYAAAQERLLAEWPHQKGAAAQAFLAPPGPQPAYERAETRLLLAFASFPHLVVPKSADKSADKKAPRIFELRTYETAGDAAQEKKISMFSPKVTSAEGERGGELDIFRRCGLEPVLFGRTLIGPRQPSFTYLLTFPDLAARESAWKTFREDPAWQKMKTTPGYTDAEIMANISDFILTPTAYSEI